MTKEILFLYCAFLVAGLVLGNTKYADIRNYPYHVSIQISEKHACSGAFIHESWIITVASCLFGVKTSTIFVRVGTSVLTGGKDLAVRNVIIHEKFDKYVYLNNIALIKLRVPAQFRENLLPISLPEYKDYRPADGAICSVTGWKQNLDSTAVPELAVTAVPIVNQSTCISAMPRYEPVSEKMVCAGNMSRGVETCQGDPGAPLIEDHTLIGVLSYGLGCKTMIHPGVYTCISSYLPWISGNSGITYM